MNLSSVIHLRDSYDIYSLDRNNFCVRLKTAKSDFSKVFVHVCDKYLAHISKTPLEDSILRFPLKKVASDGIYDYYETILFENVITFCYYFELIDSQKKTIYFGNDHFFNKKITSIENMYECPQLPFYEDRLITPSWAKGAVGYQIYPDSFARLSPKGELHANWNKAPMKRGDVLGGELKGITAHLPYLKELGVDFIYMTPIFFSPSPHKYNTTDYYKIDPSFGTNKDFIKLVKAAHKLGIKVVIDGVFNHVGTDFFAFQDVLKKKEKSKYKDWFYINDLPLYSAYREIPNYETFAYFGIMPKLRLTNPEVQKYILSVVKYWMREAKVDGWRLDVANEIPHLFWIKFREEIKKINPDALIVGEVWYDSKRYISTLEWDSAMNYPFYYALTKWLGKNEYKVTDFANDLAMQRGQMHSNAYHTLWNFIDTHDTQRFISFTDDIKDQKLAAALTLTLPGSPIIYYGDEVGLKGGNDPDCRRGMLWDEAQNKELLTFYKKLIGLRHEYESLRNGDYRLIDSFNRFNVLVFSRFNEEEEIKIIINASDDIQNNPLKGIDLITQKEVKDKIPPKTIYIIKWGC